MRAAVTHVVAASLLIAGGCGGGAGHVEPDEASTGTDQQRLSAGFLGCRPGRIAITEHYDGFRQSWIATCAGRSIICGWSVTGSPDCTDLVE